MIPYTKKAALLPLIISLAFTAGAYAQMGRLDTLREGLFLHAYTTGIGPTDPVIQRIVEGKKIEAAQGKTVTFQNGKTKKWIRRTADSEGWFRGEYLHIGYGLFTVHSSRDRVALLEQMGNDYAFINGVPRQGNKYATQDTWPSWSPSYNFSIVPIRLKKGDNQLLFVCKRSVLKVKIQDIGPEVLFNVRRPIVPNFLVGEPVDYYAAVTVINATDKPLVDAYIRAYNDSGCYAETQVPLIQPMSIRKVGFKLVGRAPSSAGETTMKLALLNGSGESAKEIAHSQIRIKIVPPTATHDVTFISSIDGSVQYYAIVPPRGRTNCEKKALFFSLHGAGVIATNMANSYYPKTWGYIVCPTNGGPYGYDWENMGRLDALQVLHIVKSKYNIDPNRVYLTGHSMGGHGTWVTGAEYPDQFAAIGASAGWISWWTYVFHDDTAVNPMTKILVRSMNPVNPYLLDKNYKQFGVYVIQGSEDNNVPISASLDMTDTLSKFHKDFVFHEEMGVGHWWSLNDQAGTDCVDWPPMFDFFARHVRPGEDRIEEIDFTTADPGVSAKDYWLTICSQQKQLDPSRVKVRFIPSRNRFVGTTKNVKILSFDLNIANKMEPFRIDLDGTRLDSVSVPPYAKKLWLKREGAKWAVTTAPSPYNKGPVRYGTFKDAFRNDVIFVYGTHGTHSENEWAFDQARFDAEFLWYQGGASVQMVSDVEFNPSQDPDRNVVLYGNENTNSAWNEVLGKSPVIVTQGRLTFGKKVFRGGGYACFMVRPRKGSAIASVGIISGTGAEGMRLAYIVPYLQPWFSLPDLTILNTSVFSRKLEKADEDGFLGQKNGGQVGFGGVGGIKVAGFFGLDWSLEHGEFVEK